MHSFRNEFFTCLFKIQNVQVIQNDVIKCCKMMSSNVALLHSNNCCVLEPAICEDLDLHVIIFIIIIIITEEKNKENDPILCQCHRLCRCGCRTE